MTSMGTLRRKKQDRRHHIERVGHGMPDCRAHC